jgi:hypothetical protein
MSELGKKLNYPQTSQIKDEATRVYARKLTRVLDDLKAELMRSLKQYIDQQVQNVVNQLGTLDHGALQGLQDAEDHLYAFLHDGSRAFTGTGPGFKDEDNMASNSDVAVASQQSIVEYVKSQIPDLSFITDLLSGPLGSVIYIWEDDEGERIFKLLIPGYYGQVLVTAGEDERPFWDWVWESPGAEGSPSIVFYLVVESSVIAGKITPDHQIAASAAIGSDYGSNLGPNEDWFEDFDRSISISQSAAKITMDHSEAVDLSGDMTIEIVMDVTGPSATPSISPSVSPSLSPSISPSISVSPSVSPSASPSP